MRLDARQLSVYGTEHDLKENKASKENHVDEENAGVVLQRLCLNSTIHGTFFLSESKSNGARFIWAAIILCSIATSGWVIRHSFANWHSNPVVTAVAQIPIEDVPFPSITICPFSNTKYDFVESIVAESETSYEWRLALLRQVITVIKEWFYRNEAVDECLCINENCPEKSEFARFKANFATNNSTLYSLLRSVENNSNIKNLTCKNWQSNYKTFRVLEKSGSIDDLSNNKAEGSLVRFLLINTEDKKERREQIIRELLTKDLFPDLYLNQKFFLDVFDAIMEQDDNKLDLGDLSQNIVGDADNFFHKMRLALHPPHMREQGVHRALFPFCWYPSELNSSCSHFQTTFNEHGLCYTYNSLHLGMDGDAEPQKLRKVQGCGPAKGLRLVLDAHNEDRLDKKGKSGSRFRIFVSVPGVVTHKVSFVVDTSFRGEHSFFLHGLHYIVSSEQFKQWNEDSRICYNTEDRNLSFFNNYAQDNCLLECRWKKLAARCGCWPWFLRKTPVCDHRGQECLQDLFRDYGEDALDRDKCDCRGDCGGLHFFTSMSRSSFERDEAFDERDFWFDAKTTSGKLFDYLLQSDIDHDLIKVFRELGESSNDSNLIKRDDLAAIRRAERRFDEDVAILNFFFDTPIITRITVEMKVTLFDQIASVGGTLGLFSGMSVITIAEIVYWLGRLFAAACVKRSNGRSNVVYLQEWRPKEQNKDVMGVTRSNGF